MIEIIAAFARWLQLVANMILIGGSVFLAIAAYDRTVLSSPWVARLERALPWLAIILLLGLLAVLATSAALATGITEHAWQPGTWLEFLQKTRTGHIWMWREGFALTVLGAVLYVRSAPRVQWRYALCATLAMLTLAVGSLASHSAAEELSVTSILPYTLHIVLAGVWFGALEIWQCDNGGVYHHPGDDGSKDESFQGFGAMVTNREGEYHFRTLRPVPYTGRTPHIHYRVTADGFDRLTTQLYVAEEAERNAGDFLYKKHSESEQALVTTSFSKATTAGNGAVAAGFNIVLG